MSRIIWLGLVAFALAEIPIFAAPVSGASLFVQPARVDLDHDGRADTAAGVLTNPSVVRVTLSRTGIHDISQPAPVLAIAGFDYDRDGDVDLLVGTSQGALLWVNDGHGAFSVLPFLLPPGSPASSPSAWKSRPILGEIFLERNEPAVTQNGRDGQQRLRGLARVGFRSNSAFAELTFSQCSPRAPPSAL